ncbi:hypothetical protein CCH79_00021032, partial [Gambusia affinis]
IVMASSKPARLKVILGESNTEKLTLPDGIPDSLDELLSKLNFRPGGLGNSQETQESMEKERIELLAAIKRRNNDRVIAEKMARTFAYRRQEVVNEEPGIEDFKDRWPALFQQKE